MADKPPFRLTRSARRVLLVLLAGPASLTAYVICNAAGLRSGTIYPVLARLEGAGWVTSDWGPPNPETGLRRRFYQLTENGRKQAMALLGLEDHADG